MPFAAVCGNPLSDAKGHGSMLVAQEGGGGGTFTFGVAGGGRLAQTTASGFAGGGMEALILYRHFATIV